MSAAPHNLPAFRRSAAPVGLALLPALPLSIVLFHAALPAHGQAVAKRRVLILDSYHHGYKWGDETVNGASRVLAVARPALDVIVEHMDTKRAGDAASLELLGDLLAHKYRRTPVDLVIASDDNALRFMLGRGREVFGAPPVVFCGVNDEAVTRLEEGLAFTGVVSRPDVAGTIRLARRLLPKATKVVVISDDTPTGVGQRRAVEAAEAGFPDLDFEYLTGDRYSMEGLIGRVSQLPRDTILLITVWLRDRTGTYIPYEEGYRRISNQAGAPLFALADLWMGHGILGGNLSSGAAHGQAAARMALRILSGREQAADIPILTKGAHRVVFDHDQMVRWGIRPDLLPEDAVIVNEPRSFLSLNSQAVATFLVVGVALAVFAVILLIAVARQHRAEAELRRRMEENRLVLGNMLSGFALVAPVRSESGEPEAFRFERVNPAFVRQTGLDPTGKTGREAFPDFGDQWAAQCARVFASGEAVRFDLHDPARKRWWDAVAYRLPNDRAVVMVSDATDRVKAERALRQSEATLRSLFQAAPLGIGMVRDRVFGIVNETMTRIVGYTSEELAGQSARMVYESDEEFRRVGKVKHADVLARGVGSIETRWRRKDGQVRDILLSSASVVPGDLSSGLVFTALDITEQKRAEGERRNLEAQIQQAQKLESLGVLAGGIAHDFNNLLMGVLGNADLAMTELPATSPARGYIEGIEQAGRRAADLCRQMLAYSGRGKFVIEYMDLNDLIEEMVHLLEVSISKKATLKFNYAEELPSIHADATQVRQVLMNLITNASEALGEEQGVISLTTGVMDCDREYLRETWFDEDLAEGDYVYVEVSDTGCGMDAETRGRLFDPFFTTKFTGRGLGMSAVLGIVRGHKGAIKVYSEPGQGSTFKVLFPAAREAPARIPTPSEAARVWRKEGRILLVDDEETVRRVARRMLEIAGFTVEVADDGRSALDMLARRPSHFDCVILDLTMPGMDGVETYREIRRLRDDLPVILSSGYNEQDAVQRFSGKGLAGFVQKPYRTADLMRELQKALAIAAAQRHRD